jgi:hypothetical protein
MGKLVAGIIALALGVWAVAGVILLTHYQPAPRRPTLTEAYREWQADQQTRAEIATLPPADSDYITCQTKADPKACAATAQREREATAQAQRKAIERAEAGQQKRWDAMTPAQQQAELHERDVATVADEIGKLIGSRPNGEQLDRACAEAFIKLHPTDWHLLMALAKVTGKFPECSK